MRRKYRWLIVITAGAAAVRLAHLGRGSIRLNELITLELIRRYNAIELVIAVPSEQPHLPLYYVALDVWVGLVGTTPPAMRLLSVMAGVLAVPAIYLLGRAMYDDTTGLIAAVLVALSRLQISQSQQARMYTLVVLLTIVSYYVFYERIRGHVPASLALIVTHPFGVLPVISQLAAGWSRRLSRSDYPNAVWGSRPADMVLGGLLVPVLAGLGTLAAGRTNPRLSPPSIRTIGEAVVVFFLSGGAFIRMAVPGLVLGVLAAISRRSTRTGRLPIRLEVGFNERLLLIGCALPIAVLVGVSYLVTPVFTPRYALVAAPPLYVLVGRGLSRISPRQLRLLVSGLLLLGMTVSVAGYHSAPQQDQWDEAVTTIESRADTDALVVVYDRIATRNVRYYLDRDLRVVGVVAPDSGTGLAPTSNATTRRYVSEHEEVWVIFTHVSPKQKRELSAVVGGTHRRRGCTDYVGLRLCRFERPPSVDAADHSRLAGRGVSATGR